MDGSVNLLRDNVTARGWRGLSGWNIYFLGKLVLYWGGWINFHTLQNILFFVFLILPVPWLWLRRVRTLIAIPIGVALFYQDTWYPPFSRLLARPEVFSFSSDYVLELLGRFINWELVGAAFIAIVGYWFLSQYVRFTAITVLALVYTVLSPLMALNISFDTQVALAGDNDSLTSSSINQHSADGARPVSSVRSDSSVLEVQLQSFYQSEKLRKVDFPVQDATDEPFDVLFLNICSMSWDDIRVIGMEQHPVIQRLDIVFERFNSVTSYSGPSAIRFMRASCGQTDQDSLYRPTDNDCYLFENLRSLGFDVNVALNHNGEFPAGYWSSIKAQPNPPEAFMLTGQQPDLVAFDASPIWSDFDTLSQWWDARIKHGAERATLQYNTITLHDGNREVLPDGTTRFVPYDIRARKFLNNIEKFLDYLEQSGRKVLVVLAPEHGASLEGDRMQIAGMREIPTHSITQVPVGAYLIGAPRKPDSPLRVQHPTSYLALSELVSRALANNIFGSTSFDWNELIDDLPETQAISENEGSIFVVSGGVPYVRLSGKDWIEYPR